VDVFPAIDIRRGRVVRLSQGERGRETAYEDDPVGQAERFIEQGARWVHVVDLDRAFGEGENTAIVSNLVQRVGGRIRIQLSGGLRSLAAVREVLRPEVARVVLGTAVVADPAVVDAVLGETGPERMAVGLDARDGMVAIRGWTENTGERVEDIARRVISSGVRTIIYTDVTRDGMLTGPDISGAVALQKMGAAVIASGGVSSLNDLRAVAGAGLAGAIVGRALYEKRFTLPEALEAVKQGVL
jgi:phosphoribosylformimino-5-aminoimidazole carboxamide ribotide isomerase